MDKSLLLKHESVADLSYIYQRIHLISVYQVVELFLKVLNGGEERGDHLSTLRKALRNPSTHLILIKYDGFVF